MLAPTRRTGDRMGDAYTMPADGWVCFHCGERFRKYGTARDHFGETPERVTACVLNGDKGLAMEVRKLQNELEEIGRAAWRDQETVGDNALDGG